MAEKHVHKVYGSFPPWGKSVEFPATGGGGGNYVYYSGTLLDDFDQNIGMSSILKVNIDSTILFLPSIMALGEFGGLDSLISAGFDLSMKVTDTESGELITVGDVIAEPSKDWTQITEEEFYKVAPDPWAGPTTNVTRYNGEVVTINYEEGMTWYEWCNSELNNTELVCDSDDEGTNVQWGLGSPEFLVKADYSGGYPKPNTDFIKGPHVISQDIRYVTYWYD